MNILKSGVQNRGWYLQKSSLTAHAHKVKISKIGPECVFAGIYLPIVLKKTSPFRTI